MNLNKVAWHFSTNPMFKLNSSLLAIIPILLVQSSLAEEKPSNIHVAMMESTFKIVGDGSTGTGFIIGKPNSKVPDDFFYTLVTVHHVLAQSKGNQVFLEVRRLRESGEWERTKIPLQIREEGNDLWQKHPDVDLAAMHVRLPNKTIRAVVATDLLLTDSQISKYAINPGTELLCLGFPFGAEASPEGFPILRSGKIAFYPLLPTKRTKTFLFDFTVFRGNSGGPVYLFERFPYIDGGLRGTVSAGIMGVVTAEKNITQKVEQLYERRETVTPLALGQVIHASFIEELINSLPEPKNQVTESVKRQHESGN